MGPWSIINLSLKARTKMSKVGISITRGYCHLTRIKHRLLEVSHNRYTTNSNSRHQTKQEVPSLKNRWNFPKVCKSIAKKEWPTPYQRILIFSRINWPRKISLFTRRPATALASTPGKATRGPRHSLNLRRNCNRFRIFMVWMLRRLRGLIYLYLLTEKIMRF